MISQLFPGPTVDESVTVQNFLATADPGPEQKEKIKETMAFLGAVVRDEDYYTGNRIQKAVKSGAKSEFLFGRNELGGQIFHQWVQELLNKEDDELEELFAREL